MVGFDLELDYLSVLKDVSTRGGRVVSRGFSCLELRAFKYVLEDVDRNVVWSPSRKLNHAFRWVEPLWMLLGEDTLTRLVRYNRQMVRFSDDGVTLDGAYGPRLMPQFEYLLTQLNEVGSRQAVATIWTPCPTPSKDIPCTISHQYLLRDGKLELIVYMRSNDAWLGFPYDVFTFTTLQKVLAAKLGVKPGRYTHLVGSFHLYASDLIRVEGYGTVSHEPEPSFRWSYDVEQLKQLGNLEASLTVDTGHVELPSPYEDWQEAFNHFVKHLARKAHVI